MSLPLPRPGRCIVFLIRHGATDNNRANPPRLQGRGVDLSLSPAGEWQAAQVADVLAACPLAAVYASPLKRATETAQRIAARHRLTVGAVPDLMEVDVGEWEGRSWVDIERTEPEAYLRFMTEPDRHGYVGGENLTQVRDRVAPALTELARKHLGEAIAVVGHNVVNRAFLADVLGMPLRRARSLSQENAGINILRYENDWKLVTLNSLFHLLHEPAEIG